VVSRMEPSISTCYLSGRFVIIYVSLSNFCIAFSFIFLSLQVSGEIVGDTKLRKNIQFKDKFSSELVWHQRHAHDPYLFYGIRR